MNFSLRRRSFVQMLRSIRVAHVSRSWSSSSFLSLPSEISLNNHLWYRSFRSLRQLNWSHFNSIGAFLRGNFLGCNLVLESLDDISSLQSIKLQIGILVKEFVDMHETSANSDLDLITSLNLNKNLSLSELVYSSRLS